MKGDYTSLVNRFIFYGCAAFWGEATLDGHAKWVYGAIFRGHIKFDIGVMLGNTVWR